MFDVELNYWLHEVLRPVLEFGNQVLRCHGRMPHTFAMFVSSLMTSCPGTSFTLPREGNERGSVSRDALEDHGCSRTASTVCGGGQAPGEVLLRALCQEFGISRPTGCLWVQRYQQQGVAGIAERSRRPWHKSAAGGSRVGEPSGGTAAALSGLGGAQAAYPVAGRRREPIMKASPDSELGPHKPEHTESAEAFVLIPSGSSLHSVPGRGANCVHGKIMQKR
jgi:hypothetical protein